MPRSSEPLLASDPAVGQLPADDPLLCRRLLEALREPFVVRGELAPALDPAGGLEPGDGGDQVAAGEVEGRRKGIAAAVVRRLDRYGRRAERAADGDAQERARLAAQLALDDGAVIHRLRS